MSWIDDLTIQQLINRNKSIRYRTESGGYRFFYVTHHGIITLHYTAWYPTLGEGVERFAIDYEQNGADPEACPTCGRSIVGRKAGSVYCSSKCSRRAEVKRRMVRERKSA